MEQHHLIDRPSGRHVSVAPQPYSHCIFLLSDPGCVRICMGQLRYCKLPTRQRPNSGVVFFRYRAYSVQGRDRDEH